MMHVVLEVWAVRIAYTCVKQSLFTVARGHVIFHLRNCNAHGPCCHALDLLILALSQGGWWVSDHNISKVAHVACIARGPITIHKGHLHSPDENTVIYGPHGGSPLGQADLFALSID